MGGGPRVGCWGRFVQFGWEPDRSGRELDSFSAGAKTTSHFRAAGHLGLMV